MEDFSTIVPAPMADFNPREEVGGASAGIRSGRFGSIAVILLPDLVEAMNRTVVVNFVGMGGGGDQFNRKSRVVAVGISVNVSVG